MKKTVIIADDLTGACDTGIKLAALGCRIEVILRADFREDRTWSADTLYAVNTNTRSVDGKLAYQTVKMVVKRITRRHECKIYKKIDSVLRGNIGPEINGALDATGMQMAIVVPALPECFRIVRDGVLHVDVPNTQHFEQNVSSVLFGEGETANGDIIPLKEVRLGSDYLCKKISSLLYRGERFCIVDAETEADLQMIADAILGLGLPVLPVGSAGLAKYLFRGERSEPLEQELVPCRREDSRGVAVVTSKHPSTKAQLQRLQCRRDTEIFTFDVEELGREEAETIACRLKKRVLDYAGTHPEKRLLVITTDGNMEDDHINQRECAEDWSDAGIVSAATIAAAEVVKNLDVNGIIASGGETASYFLNQFSLDCIKLLEEPIPGTVAARMDVDGSFPKLLLTKSGGFGDENALDNMADYILSRRVVETQNIQ